MALPCEITVLILLGFAIHPLAGQVDTGVDEAGVMTTVPDVMTTVLEVAEVEGTAVIGTTMITVVAAAAGRDIAIMIVDVALPAVAVAVLDIAGAAAAGESPAVAFPSLPSTM
jgi:hypothetical protein